MERLLSVLVLGGLAEINTYHAQVKHWVKELRGMLGPEVVLAIAGNKIDLEKSRAVDHAAAEAYAKSVGAIHYLVSAKQGTGLNEVFAELVKSTFTCFYQGCSLFGACVDLTVGPAVWQNSWHPDEGAGAALRRGEGQVVWRAEVAVGEEEAGDQVVEAHREVVEC